VGCIDGEGEGDGSAEGSADGVADGVAEGSGTKVEFLGSGVSLMVKSFQL